MEGNDWLQLIGSLLLILGSIFFVASEYALVSARKSRLEALGKRGNKSAQRLAREIDDLSTYVAGSQIGITMVGIGVGSLTEPFLTGKLTGFFRTVFGEGVPPWVTTAISFILLTFVLVVVGELCPKYATLRSPEKWALLLFRPLNAIAKLLTPIIWLAEKTATLLLRLFGIDVKSTSGESVARDELVMLVHSSTVEGTIDKMHAEMVTRALKLDVLAARDIMIHRLDVKWIDVSLSKDELMQRLKVVPYTRLPVCRGDIDDMVGIAYLHDIVKNLDRTNFSLEELLRPIVAIPENLPMEKIVAQMRDSKTQMLIVMDEYGGTSGLITLEDVVEEIFGELEDRIESERPPIEVFPNGRVSARSDVRLDELVGFLKLNLDTGDNTDTLATMIVNALERVPRPGDSAHTILGTMRVENMARRRVTRVSIQLAPEWLETPEV